MVVGRVWRFFKKPIKTFIFFYKGFKAVYANWEGRLDRGIAEISHGKKRVREGLEKNQQ